MRSSPHLYRTVLWFLGIVFSVVLLVQPASQAQSVNDWESPLAEHGEWISDRADLLPWPTRYHLNRRINKLTGRTQAELAIATLPSLPNGQSAQGFALDLFNAWGVGQRDTNTGVLLLVSLGDRRIEIITGKGLGDILPDAEVSQLIQQDIMPAFQQQDYATGIVQGTVAIAQRLEDRLPSAVVPDGLPAGVVWLPWLIALAGCGLGVVGTAQAIAFGRVRVVVGVPVQGMNTTAFANTSASLATETFPRLLARLFTPNERDWEQELPQRPLAYVWVGGTLLGMGLISGFWQFVLLHPEATLWQSDGAAWGVCALGNSAGFLWGAAVSNRFVQRGRRGQILRRHLFILIVLALLGAIWVYQIPRWEQLVLLTLCWVVLGFLGWYLVVADDLKFKHPRDYCSDRSGKPVQELSAEELDAVLTPDEALARSMEVLEFRGWRESNLSAPLTREQVYLVRRSAPSARSCRQCQSFAVEPSVRTVERAIETPQKRKRKSNDTKTAVKVVKQDVYTCCSCGFVAAYDQREPSTRSDFGSSDTSSESSSPGYLNASSESTTSYDNSYPQDYGSSSGSDFGGGSSDGGGAGSDW